MFSKFEQTIIETMALPADCRLKIWFYPD